MSLGIGSIIKLARGGMGPDEMGELLRAAGMDLSFTPVKIEAAAFTVLAQAASLPCSKMIELKGQMRSGETVTALLVVNQTS